MIRSIFALLLCLSATLVSAERGLHGPPPFSELATALSLTEAQLAPVQAIFEAQHAQMRALDLRSREKHEEIRLATRNSLAAILSVEQMQKLREFNASHRPPRHGGGRDGHDGHRPPLQSP
jgi:hypothetical protein